MTEEFCLITQKFLMVEGFVQSLYFKHKKIFLYFDTCLSGFYISRKINKGILNQFAFPDGTSLADKKKDFTYIHTFRDPQDQMLQDSTLNFLVKFCAGKTRNKLGKEKLKTFLKANKKRCIKDPDEIETEIFRLILAEFSLKNIIFFEDFCPTTLLINYSDKSRIKEIDQRIKALKKKNKYIIFLNSSEDIINYPEPDAMGIYDFVMETDSDFRSREPKKKFLFSLTNISPPT